jgi:hypothetical protein
MCFDFTALNFWVLFSKRPLILFPRTKLVVSYFEIENMTTLITKASLFLQSVFWSQYL